MKNDLVSLRGITDDDYDLLAKWLDGPAGVYANGGPAYLTGRELREAADGKGERYLVIETENRPIGAVSWRTLSYPGNYTVGMVIGESQLWARGYGAVAIGLLLDHLFQDLNAHRVEVATGIYNKETMKIVTRGTMVLEGVLRDYAFVDGEYHDVVVCSLLRGEYLALVEKGSLPHKEGAISAADKADALRMLLDYLSHSRDSYLSGLLARRREPAVSSAPNHSRVIPLSDIPTSVQTLSTNHGSRGYSHE